MPKNISVDINIVERRPLELINAICFVIGIIMVWSLTHNAWAVFWTWVASIHATVAIRHKIGDKNGSNDKPRS